MGFSPLHLLTSDSGRDVGRAFDLAFEALFVRGLRVDADLQLALGGIGVELEQLEPFYSSETWVAAIELARGYLAGSSGDADGTERRMGRACFAGTLATRSGRLLGAVLPLMAPRSLLLRAGLYMRMGRDDLVVDSEEEGEWIALRVTDPVRAHPHFFAGVIEAALDLLGATHETVIAPVDEHTFVLRVRLSSSG